MSIKDDESSEFRVLVEVKMVDQSHFIHLHAYGTLPYLHDYLSLCADAIRSQPDQDFQIKVSRHTTTLPA